jgi:hypothetical protein
MSEGAKLLNGAPSTHPLRHALENQPIYQFFERQPGIAGTRVYLASGADARMFFKKPDYKFFGWSLHNLRVLNGFFKGIDMHEIAPGRLFMRGEIRGDPRISDSHLTLDVFNIGYLLATPTDRVAPSLERITTFPLKNPRATIIVYRNPRAWPDAVVLEPRAKLIGLLPRRRGCSTPGLLCADFTSVARLRLDDAVQHQHWVGTGLSVHLAQARQPHVLMISQLYRPGWEAELSNGRTATGYRLFGGFTGFDLPPGVNSARISYQPTARIALTSLSWATIAIGLLIIVAIAGGRRQMRRGRGGSRSVSGPCV